MAALSDAQYVAPLVQSGDLLSGGPKPVLTDEDEPRRPTKTFFYVFDYQTKDGVYPQVSTFANKDLKFRTLIQFLKQKMCI